MGAPNGNTNAKRGKEWFDALRKQCIQRGSLDKIATVVCEKAEAGEPWAIAEVANRFDGKPHQSMDVVADVTTTITAIERTLVRPAD